MKLERGLMVIAFLALLLFLSVIVLKIPRPDLMAVLLVTVALAGWDLFFHKPPRPSS